MDTASRNILPRRGWPKPGHALKDRLARPASSDGLVRPDELPDRARLRAVTRCPRCGAPLYDPHDVELVAGCLYCGHVEYRQAGGRLARVPGHVQ